MRGLEPNEAAALRHVLQSQATGQCDGSCLVDGGPFDLERHVDRDIIERLLRRDLLTTHDCKLRDDILHVRVTPRGQLAFRVSRGA